MRHIIKLCSALLLLFTASLAGAATSDSLPLPKVFCADPHAMAAAKAKLATGDNSLKPALDRLLHDANHALEIKPPSVMDKRRVPPSGDKHDYMSQAPYFWADTNSPGHYIRRDGERNPESKQDSDAGHLGSVCSNTHTLALAYYFTGDERYAAKAAELVRVWFLNPATRMNPNLNFGQGVPGEVDGRPAGLIGTRGLVDLIDGIGLLATSKSWTASDQQALSAWMSDYFTWLTTSKIGRGEGDASNNHGTFYDTQATAIALFLGKTNAARELLMQAREKRIAKQIEPDGRQPRELARTLSFNYSLFNLRALTILASLGQSAGVDLWHYQTPDGRSLLAALKFVTPYADPAKQWPFQQIHRRDQQALGELLVRTAPVYPDNGLDKALKFYSPDKMNDGRQRLLFPTASL
jgi:hypothetical protein